MDLPNEDNVYHKLKKMHVEASTALARRVRLRRLVKKYGGLPFVFAVQRAQMEVDLRRRFGDTDEQSN